MDKLNDIDFLTEYVYYYLYNNIELLSDYNYDVEFVTTLIMAQYIMTTTVY